MAKFAACSRFIIIALYFICTELFAGTAPILDNTKKVIMHSHCSVVAGAMLQKRLTRYFADKGVSPCPLTVVGIDGRGTTLNTKHLPFQPDTCVNNQKYCWIYTLDSRIASVQQQYPNQPIVFFAQSGIGDNVVLYDTTKQSLIDRSVAELNYMVDEVLKRPIMDFFPSTVHFNYSHRRFAEHDPVAVRAFNKQSTRAKMIDLVTPCMVGYPLTNTGDKVHPTEYGLEIMSHEWFKALLQHDGISTVPSWSDSMILAARNSMIAKRSGCKIISPRSGKYKVGDVIDISLKFATKLGTVAPKNVEVWWRRLDSLENIPSAWNSITGYFYKIGTGTVTSPTSAKVTVTSSMFNILGITVKQPIPVTIMISDGGSYSANYTDWTNDEVMYPLDSMIWLYPTSSITTDPIYPHNFVKIMGYTVSFKSVHTFSRTHIAKNDEYLWYSIDGRRIAFRNHGCLTNSTAQLRIVRQKSSGRASLAVNENLVR